MDEINISVDEPSLSISEVSNDVVVTDQYSTDYNLPIASSSTLGGVKIGDNISEESDGTISVPIASASTVGVIKVGQNLTIESDGTLNAQAGGSSYVLPQATTVTLGGVYVDANMSSSSTNPVQNRVINSQLSTVSGNVQNLSTSLGNLSTTVGNLSTTVGNQGNSITTNTNDIDALESTVEGNTTDIANNALAISTNTSNISALQSTALSLTQVRNLEISWADIDDQVWTSGSIMIQGLGKIAFAEINLNGNLTIAAQDDYLLYTLNTNLPAYPMHGVLYTDAGTLGVTIATDGTVTLYNDGTASVTLATLKGSVPMVFA